MPYRYGDLSFRVLVGDEKHPVPFSLHAGLARAQSEFIDAAFRYGWKESEEKTIRLPDHEPEHFQLFLWFIYTRSIFSTKSGDKELDHDREWARLVDSWLLGHYLQAADFKDAVIDAIIQKVLQSGDWVRQRMYQAVYARTDDRSPLRRLVVDIAVWRWNTKFLKAQRNHADWSDFFFDLAIAQSKKSNHKQPLYEIDSCEYHEHRNNNTPCYKTKMRLNPASK